jgi:hypothetical protein
MSARPDLDLVLASGAVSALRRSAARIRQKATRRSAAEDRKAALRVARALDQIADGLGGADEAGPS